MERDEQPAQAATPAGPEAPGEIHTAGLDEIPAAVPGALQLVASDAFRVEGQDALPVQDASRFWAELVGILSEARGAAEVWIPDAIRYGAAELAESRVLAARSEQGVFPAARLVSTFRAWFFPVEPPAFSIPAAASVPFVNPEHSGAQLVIRRSAAPHCWDFCSALPAVVLRGFADGRHSPLHTEIDLFARPGCAGSVPGLEEHDARSWLRVLWV